MTLTDALIQMASAVAGMAIGVAILIPVLNRLWRKHYVWPQPPKNAVEVAVIGVGTGRNQRARWFTVFERLS